MKGLLAICIGTIFVNNFVLVRFLGLASFINIAKKLNIVFFIGLITTFVMSITSLITYLIYIYFLKPFNINFLRIIIFLMVILGIIFLVEFVIKNLFPKSNNTYGKLYPLITTNCAILGVALIGINQSTSILSSFVFGFASGIGFLLALFLMSTIMEKMELSEIPASFKGAPIAFITAGLMAMAFLFADKVMLEYLK
jgi:Na+-translocating ferredoxin:NAD+ oxidoreductase subunit A